jgi:hypothetical protein
LLRCRCRRCFEGARKSLLSGFVLQ